MSPSFSRRDVLRSAALGMAALPLTRWLGGTAAAASADQASSAAAAAALRVRHGVHTATGRSNLRILTTAIRRMKDLSNDLVLPFNSWTYQYKVHLFPDNADIFGSATLLKQAQTAELDQIYPTATLPAERANADKVWGRCPHGAPDFFAWHRMYLFYFEEIIRKVANAPSFTLPYWGYSAKSQRTIPRDLRVTLTNGVENPLYHPRNLLLNDLNSPLPLDDTNVEQPNPADRYWSKTTFEDFAEAAERVPHNRVHVAVGFNAYDGFDMLRVALAPRDPIFWLHHCEIDRIWFSWNKAGGARPDPGAAWLNETYHFIDGEGKLAMRKGSDVIETSPLGYEYDTAIPKPTEALRAEDRARELKAVPIAEASDVRLRDRSTTVKLAGSGDRQLSAERAGEGRYILELSGARTSRRISSNLDVYLNLPAGVTGERRKEFLVGVIGIFGGLHGHGGHHDEGESYQFDATEVVRRLVKAGRWTGTPEVTVLVSAGDAPAGLTFARISLKEARP